MSSRSQNKRSSKTSKTSPKKQNRSSRAPANSSGLTLSRTLNSVFPNFLRTTVQLNTAFTFNNNSTPQYLIYHANDIIRCGPATALTALTVSSYASNVPTSIAQLLSSNVNATGAGSPYNKYRVISSSIMVRWVGNTSSASASNFEGTRLILLPASTDGLNNYNHTSLSSMSTNTLMEQPKSKTVTSPHVQNTKPVTLRNQQTTLSQFGFRHASSLEAVDGFSGAVSGSSTFTPPDYIYDWIFRLSSADDGATITGDCNITVNYDVEFFGKNSPTSAVPS
jgi:hypothetical protein